MATAAAAIATAETATVTSSGLVPAPPTCQTPSSLVADVLNGLSLSSSSSPSSSSSAKAGQKAGPTRRSKPRTIIPSSSLLLPAPISVRWGQPQSADRQIRTGWLLYVDSPCGDDTFWPLPRDYYGKEANALSICVFLIPGVADEEEWEEANEFESKKKVEVEQAHHLVFFGSLTSAEKVLRGASLNVNGWRSIHTYVPRASLQKQGLRGDDDDDDEREKEEEEFNPSWPKPAAAAAAGSTKSQRRRWRRQRLRKHRLGQENNSEKSSSDDDSDTSEAGDEQLTGNEREAQERAWLAARLERERTKQQQQQQKQQQQKRQRQKQSHKAAPFGPPASLPSHGVEVPLIIVHPGVPCHALSAYRRSNGGPGFINHSYLAACRDDLVEKIRQCNKDTLPETRLVSAFPKLTDYANIFGNPANVKPSASKKRQEKMHRSKSRPTYAATVRAPVGTQMHHHPANLDFYAPLGVKRAKSGPELPLMCPSFV